jgi:epoxyqueuosine reductase
LRYTEGSPIRRIGHERWQRNIAVAMGNALRSKLSEDEKAHIRTMLLAALPSTSALVHEHVIWALR